MHQTCSINAFVPFNDTSDLNPLKLQDYHSLFCNYSVLCAKHELPSKTYAQHALYVRKWGYLCNNRNVSVLDVRYVRWQMGDSCLNEEHMKSVQKRHDRI